MTDAETDALQNYFSIALGQNVGDIDKMISSCKASMFDVAGYHDNCAKNQSLIKVAFHWMYAQQFLLCTTICVNKRIYQNVCMGVKKKKSFNGMIWNRVPKGNHASYDQGQMLGAATAANAAPQKSSH